MASVIAFISGTAIAQEETSKTVKVWGDCGMCEEKIEKAARLDGVVSAEWNADTWELSLTYNPELVNAEAVQKAIAAAGYDTEAFRGNDEAYNALPKCCQYPRKK